MTTEEKFDFIKNTFPQLVKNTDPTAKGEWGKMTIHQMVEHMTEAIKNANGKLKLELLTPQEKVPAMFAFLQSEKEFKPNTKNALMSEEPEEVHIENFDDAVNQYIAEVLDLEKYYNLYPKDSQMNPFFGKLNFDDWCQLLHKHAVHHLKQFKLI